MLIGECCDNTATMSKKKSSIKNLNRKYFHAYYHGKVLNLNINDMKKNKPSLCDVLDIIKEMMSKLPKKFFPTRHKSKNLMRMNAKNKSKGAHAFCSTHWNIFGES